MAFARTGGSDDRRPLTPKGRRRMRRGAVGLRALLDSVDRLATSPLVRARETAAIVGTVFGVEPSVVEGLAPGGRFESILAWAAGTETAAVVGHEPDLAEFVAWLLTGTRGRFVRLKKGAACLLSFSAEPGPGGAELEWLLTPKQLRLIGNSEWEPVRMASNRNPAE